jgi:replicative DNA helicase|tara:strand:- start:778 stop:2262 length:1485 start_codon:yes stop_codon:yes gene_type:complete
MTKKEQESFSQFGKSFQEKLGRIILHDRVFSDQMQEVLEYKHFDKKYLQAFVQAIFDYKQKYEAHPTFAIMVPVIKEELLDYPELVKRQVFDYLSRIKSGDVSGDDAEYVKQKSLDFCKKQKLKLAILTSVDLLQKSSFEEIQKVINEAMKLGTDNDHGHDFIQDFEVRYMPQTRAPVVTGWDEIDSITRGGLGKRELGVVVAPTGAGKSMALVHIGSRAVVMGKTVVHYTLELAETTIGLRYDSAITGVPLSMTFEYKDQIKEKITGIEGQLIVKEYPTKSATTKTLENHLDRLRQKGVEPDMIIVDYADLLRPVTTSYKQELRHSLGDIYEELRGIAQKYDMPVWTASQTNRGGLNAEVITMEAISEAFNKCFVADFICTISRTAQDKTENTGRMFVAKNRNGPDGMVYPMHMDTSKVYLEVLPVEDGGTIDSVVAKTKVEQQQWLVKKYKNYSGNDPDAKAKKENKLKSEQKMKTELRALKEQLEKEKETQ